MNKDHTKKYAGMIQAFECDFALAAKQDGYSFAELQQTLESGSPRLLKDIALLEELAYGIRNGDIKIVSVK